MALRFRSAFVNLFVIIFLFSDTRTDVSCMEEVAYRAGKHAWRGDDISVIPLERYKRQTSSNDSTASPPQTTTVPNTPTTTPDLDALNRMHDDHVYYISSTLQSNNVNYVNNYWEQLNNATVHENLTNSHRTAVTADLPFNFPFYGHTINRVTIATGGFLYVSPFIHKFLTATQYIAPLMANFDTKTGGMKSTVLYRKLGFLYMSPFLHQWLTATQYIAPLMANFDTQLGNGSDILYKKFDSKFVVEWRDVYLQDQNTSAFRFQAILHRNGSIVFIYKDLPLPIKNISSTAHPVKIGLSDAFYYDTMSFGIKRRTIYEYHRVTLNISKIQEGSVVMIHPLPTCNLYNDCEQCISSNINFECRWCGIVQRCSDSLDWHRQEWLKSGCVHLSGDSNCSLIPISTPKTPVKEKGTQVAVIIVVVVILVALIGGIGGWVYYAYTHPTSASGMWLMEHRPSQMKAKINNMKFWKRNTSSGDKYAIESTA